ADRGGVRAGVGLRQAERAELVAADRRHEIRLFLVVRAELEDRDAAETDVRQQGGGEAAVDAADLLDEETAHHHVAAAPAVLLRVPDAEIAEPPELPEQILRKRFGALQLVDPRRQ